MTGEFNHPTCVESKSAATRYGESTRGDSARHEEVGKVREGRVSKEEVGCSRISEERGRWGGSGLVGPKGG